MESWINMLLFFKQKKAYEVRISDWSSDVCSSDLKPTGKSLMQKNDSVGFAETASAWNPVAMQHADFVHLRVHSAFSLSQGAIRTKDLVKLCATHRMPAVAVTDSGNLFGAL